MRTTGNDELILTLIVGTILVVLATHFFLVRQSRLLKTPLWTGSSRVPKLVLKARDLFDKGQFQASAVAWEDLLREFEKSGNIPGIVSTANMIGLCFEKLQNYVEAEHAYSCATSVDYGKDFADGLFHAYKRRGYCQLRLGNAAAAQQSYTTLAQLFRQQNDFDASVTTLVSLANTLGSFGHLEEAGKTFEEARGLASRLKTDEGTRIVFHDLALFLHTLGRTREALERMREAAELSLQGKDLAAQARTLCSLADLLNTVGEKDQAENSHLQAVALADLAQSPRERALAQYIGGRIAWSRGDRHRAYELLELAEQTLPADKEDKGNLRANILTSKADYAEESNDFESALLFSQAADGTGKKLTSRQSASLLFIKTRALAKSGKGKEALDALREAEALARMLKAPLYQAAYAKTAGVVDYTVGSYAAALSHHQEALEFLEKAGLKRASAFAYKHLAATWSAMGNESEAAGALEKARQIFLDLGDTASAGEGLGQR
jgi:tetratricopeptide (TPR) repeat protein